MNITLRKASALQNSIQEHIKTINARVEISINEFQNPTDEVLAARNELMANDQRRANLTRILYNIRAAVGRANATSGIADLLSDAAYIDKRMGQLRALADSTATATDAVLTGKLEKLRTTDTKHHLYNPDTVTTGVLTADQIEAVKVDILNLKKNKQTINDKILELNVRTEVELDDVAVNLLKEEGLL